MNYFEFHVGDYEAATAHLSMIEDAAYCRMLRIYYRTEKPLPADVKQVCRLVRAQSKDERAAVQTILDEFFTLAEDGWHQSRCDREIGEYHDMEPEREAKRENAKERQRRSRERRASLFEALRCHNIVPSYDTPTRMLETMLSRVTGASPDTAPVTPVTRDDTVTHIPPPTSHLPPPKVIEPSVLVASKPRPTKKAPANLALSDDLRAWAAEHVPGVDADAELEKLKDHTFATARTDWPGTVRNWLRKAQQDATRRAPPPQRQNGHDPEPTWRREQRERNVAFLGPAASPAARAEVAAAAASHTTDFVDMETAHAATRIVG